MNKKAYLRTIEVSIAIILTFIIAYFLIPSSSIPSDIKSISILPVLEQDPGFRNCVTNYDFNCTENYLRDFVPPQYDFAFDLTQDPDFSHANLPEQDIYTESIYMSGNINLYNPKIIKLYYWRKGG